MGTTQTDAHTEEELPKDSVQLEAGQNFHHQGGNGIVYFKLRVEKKPDGSLYPMTMTAPACNVLPLECDSDGNIVAAYFLLQEGRPEMGTEAVALKATGAFLKVGEAATTGAIRALKDRIGINGREEDLIHVGQSYGFGDQFRFPIDLYVIKDFTVLEDIPTEGCTRLRMTFKDIAHAQKNRSFFNSETLDLVATALLRNVSRDTFGW